MKETKVDRSRIEAKLKPSPEVIDRIAKFKEQLVVDLQRIRPKVAAGCCCCCCCCCCGDVAVLER